MAKNKKPVAPKTIPHKDHYARITYLYQASTKLAATKYHTLSRALARNVDLVAKKTVLKLTPELKRTMCKRCNSMLIPGISMTIRVENTSKSVNPANDVLVHECMHCGQPKRFPIGKNRDYVVFSERPDIKIAAK